MNKYIVEVEIYNKPVTKELTIYASSEEEASEKVSNLVLEWSNVDDVDVINCYED